MRLDDRGWKDTVTGSDVARKEYQEARGNRKEEKAEIVDASGSAARKASKSVLPVEKG